MNGSEPSQNKKKDTKATVFVPELGMPFLIPPRPLPSSCEKLVKHVH
jgi:hypothetical protein